MTLTDNPVLGSTQFMAMEVSPRTFIKAEVRIAAFPRQETDKLRKAITEAVAATGNGRGLLHDLRGYIYKNERVLFACA
jgi:hypothetical protein